MITRLPPQRRGTNPKTITAELGGLGGNINPGQSLSTQGIPCQGARRYRVKVFSTFGSVDVHARDARFAKDAVIWEDVNLGPTVVAAGGFRMVANFGEGTGFALTFGNEVVIRCTNTTAGIVRVARFELWIQW